MRNRRERCGNAVCKAERLWRGVENAGGIVGMGDLERQSQEQRRCGWEGAVSQVIVAKNATRTWGTHRFWSISQKLGCGLGLDGVAEASEEAERGFYFIVFALFFFHGGLGLLVAAPENYAVMGIEDEETYLGDAGGGL